MQKLTDTLMSSSSYSNSRSRKNGNCGDDRRDDNGNGNGDGNSAINIPEELSRLLVERNSTMEDLNYYVFDSASLRDELNERLAQCLAIDPKTDNLGNKVEVNYFKTPMESLEIKRDGHNEESVLALRWADAHIKVLEFALQTSTVGLNTFSECVHFTARCIHWNAQVELAVAYDMKNWLVEVLGQEKLESDTDFFGSHRPPPDIYQPALDFSQFNSIDVAATGGDIGQGASLNSYLVWLYWGPTITAWSVRARNGRPVVCLIPEHELQEDDINYLKSIMPKLP